MAKQQFDIAFLCHEKDKEILAKSITYAKKNVVGYRKIFIVSKENYFPERKDLIFISEQKYPFSKEDIAKHAPKGRGSWYYQQFLKLYFLSITKNVALNNVLMIDADTMFLRKIHFFNKGKALYNVDIGIHQPYYDILEKIYGFGKQHSKFSGTTHHMLFQRQYLEEALSLRGKIKPQDFWKEIMKNINKTTESGFSEQDLYFNYQLKYHPEAIKIRRVPYMNFPYYNNFWIKLFTALGFYYLSSHDYLRKEKFSAIKRIIIELLTLIGIKRYLKEFFILAHIAKTK